MDKISLIDIALVEWTARFKGSSKKTKDARNNFEDLFQKWKDVNATFEDVYETYLPKAIKAHQPLPSVAKNVYKKVQQFTDKSEKEFISEWNDSIESTAQEVFFEYFQAVSLDHDPEPKSHGNMSATEYRAQRRYSEQFPILKTDSLIKQWKQQQQEYNLSIDDILENVLGDEQ